MAYTFSNDIFLYPEYREYVEVYIDDVLQVLEEDVFGNISFPKFTVETDFVVKIKVLPPYQFVLPIEESYFDPVLGMSVKMEYEGTPFEVECLYTIPHGRTKIEPELNFEIREQPSVEQFPFINIYDVELDQLEALNKYRFTELVYNNESILIKDSDLSNYIVNLIKFPFTVAGGDPTNILIGNKITTFTGNFINSNLYEIDLGSIFVPMAIQGSVSFSNVTIECYIPYMKKFLLDTDEVLGKVLEFKMIVNLLTGLVTINVLNTSTQSIIYSDNVLVGESIPNAIGGGVDVSTDTILNNATDTVYIEVKTLQPKNNTVTDQLLNVSGFIQVENVLINSVATIEEQDEIRRLLKQGVYINE